MNESWIESFERCLQDFEDVAARSADFPAVRSAALTAAGCLGNDAELALFLMRPDLSEAIQPDGTTSRIPDASMDQHAADPCSSIESLADDVQLIVRLNFSQPRIPESSLPDAVQAMAAVFASFISRHLLNRFQTEFAQQGQLLTVLERLIGANNRNEIANIVAQDAAACFGNVRVAVIEGNETNQRLLAATGVDFIDQESESVRELKRLAYADPSPASARVIALSADLRSSTVVVIDGPDQSNIPDRSLQLLKNATEKALRKADSTLFARMLPRSRRIKLSIAAIIALLLCLWPVDFEIEVLGQMQPTQSRNIFAPDDGVIEKVMFTHEQQMTEGQPYLVIRNEQIDREIQQLRSQVESAETRLATVTALKLSGTDPNASVNEQLIQTELESATAELKDAESRQLSLTMTCPYDGFVYRQDPESTLLNRPVVKGQRLGEVVKESTAWQVELQIPEDKRAYLKTTGGEKQHTPIVRFYLRSAPGNEFQGRLTKVEHATQFSPEGLATRAIVTDVTVPHGQLRPGMSVVSRIHCGRRSAGFVWFREVIELVRYLKFAMAP